MLKNYLKKNIRYNAYCSEVKLITSYYYVIYSKSILNILRFVAHNMRFMLMISYYKTSHKS